MVAHMRLVAVIAETLAATLQLLGWRQMVERPSRGCRPCCCWNSSRAGSYRKGRQGSRGHWKTWPLGWPGATLSCGQHSGVSPTLERPGQMHGRLKVPGLPKLHVDFDMLREAANK